MMLIAYLITIPLTSRVVPHIFSQDRAEGFFRYAHARIRTYVESIAFYNGEKKEEQYTETALQYVLLRNLSVIRKQLPLNCKLKYYRY